MLNESITHRNWVPRLTLSEGKSILIKDEIKSNTLRVTTYNILADSLVENTASMINDLDKNTFLNWESRRTKIIRELTTLNSDIICVQEFERDEIFINEMGKHGYDVCFKPRTGGSHTEGNAIFWKFEKFDLENLYCLEFNLNKASNIYNKDNISIFAVLRQRHFIKNIFIVATTHLLFNLNRGDIKLAQTLQTLNTLDRIREKYKDTYHVNVIFTGDFNSVSNSGIYKLITEGKLDCTNIDYKKISGQNNGQLNNYELSNNKRFFKSSLIKNNCSKFDEQSKFLCTFQENKWIYEVLSYQPIINENDLISLIPVDVNKMKIVEDEMKILLNPLKMKSAYSQNLKNIIEIVSEKCSVEVLRKCISPKDLQNIDVYGIKINSERIDSTINFLKDLTLEPPLTFFAKNTMVNVDFIFYEGNMHVLRTLNTPDVYSILDMKSLPNHVYPSDHLSLTADFIMC